MDIWPDDPVAGVTLVNAWNVVHFEVSPIPVSKHTVKNRDILFRVGIDYKDDAICDQGIARFTAELIRLNQDGTRTTIVRGEKSLGDGENNGKWKDYIELPVTMVDTTENYEVVVHGKVEDTWPADESSDRRSIQAVLQEIATVATPDVRNVHDLLPKDEKIKPPVKPKRPKR